MNNQDYRTNTAKTESVPSEIVVKQKQLKF